MKAIKRTVAALLATLMLATSTSFTLAAETYTDDEAVVVAKVSGAGIMTGTDKGFEPSKSLTRAEAAAIIVRMKGIKESAVKAMAGTTLFKDVAASHWASGYVNEASQLAIVKGVSATEFAPDREVTVAEFVTMAIRALGAGTMVDAEGTWPTNYVNFANENDLLEDVTAVYTATATRMNAATIVANTLVAPMWAKTKATTNKEVTWEETEKTILSNVLNIAVVENVNISDIKLNDRTIDWASVETEQVLKDPEDPSQGYKTVAKYSDDDADVADVVALSTLKTAIEYDIWYDTKAKEIVAIFKTEDNKKNVVEFTEIKKVATSFIRLVVDGKEVEYDLTANSKFALNGKDTLSSTKIAESDLTEGKENYFGTVVIDGKEVTAIYANAYTNFGIVDEITDKKIELVKADQQVLAEPVDLKYTNEDYTFFVTKNGKEISVKDIKEDDAIFYYTKTGDSKVYYIDVVSNSEEGTVTATGSKYVKLDGTKYNLVDKSGFVAPTVDSEVVLYFNKAGKVTAYDSVDATGKYAVVRSVEFIQGRKGIDVEVVLAYEDGTLSDTMILELEDKDVKWTTGAGTTEDPYVYAKSYSLVATGAASSSVAALNDLVKDDKCAFLGLPVEYSIKGGKLIIMEYGKDIAKENTTYKSAELTKANLVIGTKSFIEETKSGEEARYYVTKNTKFLSVKTFDDEADKYKVKVESYTLDDLETNLNKNITGYIVDFDDDNNNRPSLVVFTSGVKRVSAEEDWAIVLDVSTDKTGDFASEVTVVTSEGKERTLDYDDTDLAITNIGILNVIDDELTELEVDSDYKYINVSAKGDVYRYQDNDGIIELVTAAPDTDHSVKFTDFDDAIITTTVLADKVIYIKEKSTGNVVGNEADIDDIKDMEDEEYASDADCTDAIKDYTLIRGLYTYTNEDGVIEIIAVIYK